MVFQYDFRMFMVLKTPMPLYGYDGAVGAHQSSAAE